MSGFLNQNVAPLRVANQAMPDNKQPLTLPYVAKLAASATDSLDLTNLITQQKIDQIQAVYIDNSLNGSSVSIVSTVTNQTVTCPANAQGWFPLLVSINVVLNFSSVGGVNVPFFFVNVPMPVGVWSASAAGSPGSPVIGLVPVSASVAATTVATSTVLMGANAARKYLFIAPTADTWINFLGGASGVDALDSVLIPAGASYENGPVVSTAAITYYDATGGNELTAYQGG